MDDTGNTSNRTEPKDIEPELSSFQFHFFHWTAAVVPLCMSLISCSVVLASILLSKPRTSFIHQPIGVRLTVYLAVCDLLYSSQQMSHDVYHLTALTPLPPAFCSFIGRCEGESLASYIALCNTCPLGP